MSEGPDPVAICKLAEIELASMTDSKMRLLDEHAASFRWLIASLFAANGGALVALGNNDLISIHGRLWAGGLFTVGVFTALLTGWSNQRSARKMIEPVSALTALWACVASGMPFDVEQHNQLLEQIKKGAKASWPTRTFGWAAAILFLAGMIVTGAGVEAPAQSIGAGAVHTSK